MIWGDLRYSARSLTRTPGLTFALLLTIALGIGGNASMLGFIRGSVTRQLPLAGIDTIVSLFARNPEGRLLPVSYARYLSLKAQHSVFGLLGAARESQASIAVGERTSIMSVAAVTSELADLLDLSLKDGVVISHRVWRLEFGARAEVRGERIRIDGADARVADVAPEWLEGLYSDRAIDIWMPLSAAWLQGFDRKSRTFWLLGRLPAGISPDQAQTVANSNRNDDDPIVVLPYSGMPPDAARGILLIGRLLPATTGAVFLIACANVAAFLWSRASARSHDRSVCVALGASRRQLGGQLFCDSVLVSVTGGAFGILLAFWTARIIPALLFEQDAAHLAFAPDLASIVAASTVCAGVLVGCGLMAMFEIRHDDPGAVLRRASVGSSRTMRRLRAGLVVMQMTCCCLLVICTALLFESFHGALRTSAANRLGRPVLATVQARLRFERPDLGLKYFRDADRAVRSLPVISTTAWTGTMPGSQPTWYEMRIEPPHLPIRDVTLDVAAFTPRSPAPIILPPSAGRMFGGVDTPQSCRVRIVNQEAAEELFHGDAVGRSIQDPTGERVEIIGVVAMRKAADTTARNRPTIYYYAEQTGTAPERAAPATFHVPRLPRAANAVLGGNIVSASYFDAMGMSLIAGSGFPDDSGSGGCRVGLINQEAAELYFGGNAVGGAVIDGAGRRTKIIGVVHSALLRNSQRREEPAIYFPMGQDFRPRMTLILGARNAPDALLTSVQQRLETVPGGAPGALVVTTLDTQLGRTALASERVAAVLVGACAAAALTLGVLGLYGAMGDAARQRQREIALRLALGAQRWRVMCQLLVEGVRLAAAGSVAGLIASLLVARWLAATMPSIGAPTVWVWLAAPLVLLAAVAIASVLPVRRALTVKTINLMHGN